VRAPCDGRITALDIAAGEFAATGHPLFAIIDTEHWYAIGNFRETDLAGMAPGVARDGHLSGRPPRDLLHRLIRLCGETAAFEYRSRAAQVRCLEALREPITYRRENSPRIIMPILPYP
jgi:multidrug resistance efflux pump